MTAPTAVTELPAKPSPYTTRLEAARARRRTAIKQLVDANREITEIETHMQMEEELRDVG